PHLSSGAGFALTKKRFQMMYTTSGHWSRQLTKVAAAGLIWAVLIVGFGKRGLAQTAPPQPPQKLGPKTEQDGMLQINQKQQKLPNQDQLDNWAGADFYIVIDKSKVNNAALQAHDPEDFSHYYRSVRRTKSGKLQDVIILFTEANYPWPDIPLPPPPPPPVGAPLPPPPPPAPPAAPPKIDWSTVSPKVPTSSQLEAWRTSGEYGIWIDGEQVKPSRLTAYNAKEFSYYTVSKLHKNAKNYAKFTYHLNLMTTRRFERLQRGDDY
ncbi:MAG: hypothetical protein AAF840_06950, partial [Bacteroidota bacterium]